MQYKKDYSLLTLKELLKEEKNTKQLKTLSAFMIGAMTGVMIYSIFSGGFKILKLAGPLFLILLFYKISQDQIVALKAIHAEIKAKS